MRLRSSWCSRDLTAVAVLYRVASSMLRSIQVSLCMKRSICTRWLKDEAADPIFTCGRLGSLTYFRHIEQLITASSAKGSTSEDSPARISIFLKSVMGQS